MAIHLDHTIVPARDKVASATFFARIFGLEYNGPHSHFAPVRVISPASRPPLADSIPKSKTVPPPVDFVDRPPISPAISRRGKVGSNRSFNFLTSRLSRSVRPLFSRGGGRQPAAPAVAAARVRRRSCGRSAGGAAAAGAASTPGSAGRPCAPAATPLNVRPVARPDLDLAHPQGPARRPRRSCIRRDPTSRRTHGRGRPCGSVRSPGGDRA